MNHMTLFAANVVGNEKNTRYPHQRVITNSEELKDAVAHDHVTATYQANTRSASGFVGSDCVVMDIDNDHTNDPTQWITPEGLAEVFPLLAYYTATSRNHMMTKGMVTARPRFHVYFPIQPCSRVEDYVALKKTLAAQYPFFDANALDAARFIYGNPDADVVVDEFAVFDQHTQHIHEGSRNATMSRFAGRVLIRYGDSEAARALFDRKAALCDPPLEAGELETIWRSARRFATKVTADPSYVPPQVWEQLNGLKPEDFTDVGQATLIASECADKICFSPETGWIAYTQGVWDESEPKAQRVFQDFTYLQLQQAEQALNTTRGLAEKQGVAQMLEVMSKTKALAAFTPEQNIVFNQLKADEAWVKFTYKSRADRGIQAAMRQARSLLLIDSQDLDKDPYLFNTPAGTYDLRFGAKSLRAHDPFDLLTKQTQVNPSEQGKPLWEDTLNTIFQNDHELISYVQQVCGLAAIGKVMVEGLIIAYGDGNNGKSTFWNTIARVLGTYAETISAEVLIAGKKNNAKNDMAQTRGRRLLIAGENDEGVRLSGSAAKQLASTDKIAAEKKYKDPFSFTPSHTLVLYTNHLPKVTVRDTGIWRRLIVIPFNATITPKQDVKNYADHLYEHAAGAVLAWIMEGARIIHQADYKLQPPECVVRASQEYRRQNDWFAHFIEECCQTHPDYTERSLTLYDSYRQWANRRNDYVRNAADFYEALEKAGFSRKRTRQAKLVTGLRLISEFSQTHNTVDKEAL